MTKPDPKQPILQADLADALGVRQTTLKYYTQLGLLPYETKGKGKARYYKVAECKPILADIKKLKAKGYKMVDIVTEYAKQGKLAHSVDLTLLNFATMGKGGENE